MPAVKILPDLRQNLARSNQKSNPMRVTLLVVLVLLSDVLIVAVPAVAQDAGPPPALAPGQAPPLPKRGPLADPRSWDQVGFPKVLTEYAISPTSLRPAQVALGQKLFFEPRLSGDGTVACATCHDPARAFTDGRPLAIGIHGRVGQRNSPTVLNALYNKTQFWDGRVTTLEEQAALPIVNPLEMGQPSLDAAVAQLTALGEYQQAFQAVFGRPPNGPDLVRAIASYERAQASFDSPFDHFI